MRVRGALLIVLAIASTFLAVPGASAHANLVNSEPPANAVLPVAPDHIVLYFSEEPEPRFTEVRLLASNGVELPSGPVATQDGSDASPVLTVPVSIPGEGTFTVAWRTQSHVDGHPTRGTFAFTVGPAGAGPTPIVAVAEPGLPPEGLATAVRWLSMLAFAGLLGTVLFGVVVVRPVLARFPAIDRRPIDSGFRCLLAGIALALVVGAGLAFIVQAWRAGDGWTAAFGSTGQDVLLHTRFGKTWVARAVLTAAAAILVAGCVRSRATGVPWPAQWALLVVAVALPATTAANSHTAAANGTTAGTALAWVHYVAACAWVGGLVAFLAFLGLLRFGAARATRRNAVWAAVPRFSKVATASVVVLIGSGVVQWWTLLGSIDDTFSSSYGLRLVVKAGLLVPLLALAAFNFFVVGRSIRHRVTGRPLLRRFQLTLAGEAVLGVMIIIASGLLGESSPPVDGTQSSAAAAGQEGLRRDAKAEGTTIALELASTSPGRNRIVVRLSGDIGKVDEAVVRFTFQDEDLGVAQAPLQLTNDTYYWEGDQLSLAGRWTVQVIFRREDRPDISALFKDIDLE